MHFKLNSGRQSVDRFSEIDKLIQTYQIIMLTNNHSQNAQAHTPKETSTGPHARFFYPYIEKIVF
ncbi:hypothetical protein O185_19775 [Photorhabdus temperata J3]|uniref:Uncharacterized protein n=1 Tax=Photorhabdus temperata J3 TaxID=1389415 RepID=U7QY85_PHOTE|nr:hypothetical protein O185_19775 [Photorhabdus temperata J3]